MSFCAAQVFVLQIRRLHKSRDNEVNYGGATYGQTTVAAYRHLWFSVADELIARKLMGAPF